MSKVATIVNSTQDNVVCERTEIAGTLWRRLRGLLGRASLPPGQGLLLEPEPSIHSAFMRFEFDAVFLSREMEVLKLVERIPPWRTHAAKGARKVLELSSGEIAQRKIAVGDILAIVLSDESSDPRAAEAGTPVDNPAGHSVDDMKGRTGEHSAAAH